MNNTTENIPDDVMETARGVTKKPDCSGFCCTEDPCTSCRWWIRKTERIAQALLAERIQGLRMAAGIADSLCETTSGYDPMAVAIMDAITEAADELNGTHTG